MSIKEAFFNLCAEAKPAEKNYVSLYQDTSYYGGPEEGGWWGSDTVLVAYQEAATDEEAEAMVRQVRQLAEQLSAEAKDIFNRQCLAETQWLEARGLDDDFLREVDGEQRFWVTTEHTPGSCNHEGSRHYE